MPRARVLTGDRLLTELDHQAHAAANKADLLRIDPALHVYAPLFDHAAEFWRDLKQLAEHDWPMSLNQRFALDYIANGTTKGARR
jgi:predicted DNA-binding ribbon-helix-helix protein